MNKARTEKVAVVDEVKDRVGATSTAVVTEYRGLTVAEISSLRRSLRAADAEYKVLKNTLVRRAVAGTPSESLSQFLEGPTAIAWVNGDISAVAKILKEFAKSTPTLILKGGVLDGKALSAADLSSLADLPSRDVLLAQLAGLLASPMRQMAGLLKAVPQNFAYGLAALLESKGGAPAATTTEEATEATETPAGVEDAAPAASDDTVVDATEVAEMTDATEATVDTDTTEVADAAADGSPAE